jgi:uncharacterized protein YndB with AHSA1/START domain
MHLTSEASLQIQKPVQEVFEAIVNPQHMTQYFISESSGAMETGVDLLWKFPEFADRYPVTEVQVAPNQSVSFVWDPETRVTIKLEAYTNNSTIIRVNEGGKENNEANLQWLMQNTGGWANFLACMKAYLEYGVQLRKGAYDFMQPE